MAMCCIAALAGLALGLAAPMMAEADLLGGANTLDVVVDAGRSVGPVNVGLLGVNHGPLAVHETGKVYDGRNAVDLSDRYRELGVRSVRLDEFGAIDLQSLFPDFTADPEAPENYRFGPADAYLKAIRDVGAEIVFRMGYSEKPRRVDPPSDNDKWARVMVQVAKHYNDGWAEGHHWDIRHWEVWNEPSGEGWTGTLLEYCRLYETVANAMKAYDPSLQVGGPSLGSPDARRDKELGEIFIWYCRERGLPIDFFSWHLYGTRPQEYIEHAERHRRNLSEAGFADTPLFLTEWGWFSGQMDHTLLAKDFAGVEKAAADISIMAVLHDRVERAHFYVGGALAGYPWGLFDFVREPDGPVSVHPRKVFHAFKAYRILTEHPNRLWCHAKPGVDEGGCAVLAGIDAQGAGIAILLSNYGTDVDCYRIRVESLPWQGSTVAEILTIDEARDLQTVDRHELPPGDALMFEVPVERPSVCLVRLTQASQGASEP